MTTKGWLISGVAAVAVLFAGGLLLVYLSDRGAAGAASAVRPATGPAAVAPQEPAPRATPAPPAVRPEPSPPAEEALTAPPAAPALPTSMEERIRALEPLRLEVMKGLAEHDGRIEACRLRGVELVLTLETLDGRVRILDAVPRGANGGTDDSGGAAPVPPDEEAVRCVRGALGRTVFAAPSASPGREWQMSYVAGSRP